MSIGEAFIRGAPEEIGNQFQCYLKPPEEAGARRRIGGSGKGVGVGAGGGLAKAGLLFPVEFPVVVVVWLGAG